MAHYIVRYLVDENNQYVYPKSVEGVIWKSAVYHYTHRAMIGETDDEVAADGKEVIALKPDEAEKQVREYQSSYPDPEELPDELL